MKNLWHEIETGQNPPEIINVIVENPMGSRKKYEYNKEYNLIEFDRVIFSPFHYPGDYGFIPKTYCEDGDALDALILTNEPSHPMVLIKVRPVAVLKMIDENKPDDKIISVPINDPRFNDVKDKKDLSKHLLKEIQHFFKVYKELEGKKVKTRGWGNAEEAKKTVMHCIFLYKRKFE